ncbi:hypothetical protein BCR34DRAFT_559013 [Clohesyomyces aquaticus]|uniref:Microbial-type PARG catalytic domain-containing protein n=1 Tax=Clohesyomyces aquaticus TaxID=1231657 RepID=A0A1Y1ZZ31_9PLEO|nr:hypothetical protein BCR34DRAFT_559013 [Clohesyomyces aquaticus]
MTNINMGRAEQSQGLAPPSIRKDIRAKQARNIVNKVIPAILASNPRAKKGTEGSELIVDPPPNGSSPAGIGSGAETSKGKLEEQAEEPVYIKRKGQGKRRVKGGEDDVVMREGYEKDGIGTRGGVKSKGKAKQRQTDSASLNDGGGIDISTLPPDPTLPPASPSPANPDAPPNQISIRVIITDTLTATHMLSFPWRYPPPAHTPTPLLKPPRKHKQPNVCLLNMASPLRPGGGILVGATSQEEFLCARTTLLPSLSESFYRLPEIGGVFTSDVLVFRDSKPLGDPNAKGELAKEERWWVDVISAGMLRFPELEGEEEEKRLGKKDRELVERKMRAVLRIATAKGARKLVLGAWGCGAYGNPVKEIAAAWKRVMFPLPPTGGGQRKGKGKSDEQAERWENIEEVVFAISNARMAKDFTTAFGGGVVLEVGPGGERPDDESEEEDKVAEELRNKIKEMESQVSSVWNADLKTRMGTIMDGLREQLTLREGSHADAEDSNDKEPPDDVGGLSGDEKEDEDDDSEAQENSDENFV